MFIQVKDALLYMAEQSLASEHLHTDIIVYASSATQLDLDRGNYRRVIQQQYASGLTDFRQAFECIKNVVEERKRREC